MDLIKLIFQDPAIMLITLIILIFIIVWFKELVHFLFKNKSKEEITSSTLKQYKKQFEKEKSEKKEEPESESTDVDKNKCEICNKKLNGLTKYKCRYCLNYHCDDHRLPEEHNCQGEVRNPHKLTGNAYYKRE